MKRIYVLTGPSGAGTSTAKFVFEERGFYIVENFPAALISEFADKIIDKRDDISDYCLIARIFEAKAILLELKKHSQYDVIPILLDCKKEELMRRFTLNRRVHPNTVLAKIPLEQAIDSDYANLAFLRQDNDIYIDTTKTTVKELRNILINIIDHDEKKDFTTVSFVSFGLKNGIQKDIDMLIDCRTLPNPYWVETLKEKNGLDKEIIDYLNSYPETKEFLENTIKYLEYQLKEMQKAGRGYYVVGVACSGGQHRSTYVADYLARYFSKQYKTTCTHRDTPELNK